MKRKNLSIRRLMIAVVWIILLTAACISGIFITLLYLFRFAPLVGMRPFLLPVVTMLSCIVIGSLLSLPATRFIIGPLKRLVEANKQVAAGNFNVKVDESAVSGELRELMVSFNQMTSELSEMEIFRNDFINNFSHEFKTPIVSIRGFAHQLLYDEGLSEEQKKEYISIIASESDRLSTMASNVLLLSKLEHQQILTDLCEFDLDEQIRRCILLLEKQWGPKNIQWNIELDVLRCRTSEELLSHVWINLLSNAIKFTPDGGEISVTLRPDGGGAVFFVKDTGIGMSRDTVTRIFDKFYQCDHSHTTTGNGLGLSLVKRIIELVGGEISVRSELGRGSEFRVWLPTAAKSAEKMDPQKGESG